MFEDEVQVPDVVRRSHHHGRGSSTFSIAGPLYRHPRRRSRAPDYDRYAAGGCLDVPLHYRRTFGVRELVRFTHDAENGKAMYPGAEVEFGQRIYSSEVHVTLFGEGGQGYGADAAQGHGRSI